MNDFDLRLIDFLVEDSKCLVAFRTWEGQGKPLRVPGSPTAIPTLPTHQGPALPLLGPDKSMRPGVRCWLGPY